MALLCWTVGLNVRKRRLSGHLALYYEILCRVIMVSPPLFCAAGIFWFVTVKSPSDTTHNIYKTCTPVPN